MKKKSLLIIICVISIMMSGCFNMGKSDVKTVIIPDDAQQNLFSGSYENSKDGNVWKFNADGTLVITSNDEKTSGEYELYYADSSMYLTNVDGVTIQFFYHENKDGELEITINGKNVDTSILSKVEE